MSKEVAKRRRNKILREKNGVKTFFYHDLKIHTVEWQTVTLAELHATYEKPHNIY